ncbi:hypothetical protein AAG906_020636 [Vitis piasezkii]
MTEYSVHLISRLDPLRYLFDRPALAGRLMRWLVLLTEFDIHYVSQKSIKGSVVADHLASLPIIESRPIDDDFPDEEFVAMTRLSGWRMYFDGAANHSGYGIVLRQVRGDWKTRDAKLKPYHAYLELLIEKFEELKYIHLLEHIIIDIPTNVVVHPFLIETRSTPAYCHLIDETSPR